MIDNPFAVIDRRINRLETLLLEIRDAMPLRGELRTPENSPFGDFKWLKGVCSGIPASTLRIKSAAGEIPGTKKVGRRVIYEKAEVITWLRSQSQQTKSTSEELTHIAEVQIDGQLAKQKSKFRLENHQK